MALEVPTTEELMKAAPPGLDSVDLRLFISQMLSLRAIAKEPSETESVWHYTTGQGLLGIIGKGALRATQIACLNDTQEHQHLPALVQDEAARREADSVGEAERAFYSAINRNFRGRTVDALGMFATCFSRKADDLGQWRGYGGGDCGFAIEFDVSGLRKFVAEKRPSAMLLRMNYDADDQSRIARTILDQHLENFRLVGSWSSDRRERWMEQFGQGYRELHETVYGINKHPSFLDEDEVRLLIRMHDDDHLAFNAKRTLLARYIEFDATVEGKLPIRSIMVGPGGAQSTTAISVGDLLKGQGYLDVGVLKSRVPFRTP